MSIIRIQGINEIENGIVYEVDTESKPLGVGGMGQVFRGKRIDSKGVCMDVAIKFLFDDLPQHVIERARREASIQIHNENLVEMFGFIQIDERVTPEIVHQRYHVVSELLEGVMLFDLLKGKTTDNEGKEVEFAQELYNQYLNDRLNFALFIVRNVLSGIMALHDKGYIHRDIDPSNIMVTADRKVKIIDFGIAKQLSTLNTQDQMLTTAGQFMGKATYAAPELVVGDVVHQNKTTDIYAVGILLFQLITGHLPFDGATHEVLDMQLHQKMPLQEIEQKNIRKIIGKATAKKQMERFQSAAEFRVALEQVESGAGSEHKTLPPVDFKKLLPDEGLVKNRKVWMAAGGAAVLLVGGILLATIGSSSGDTEERRMLEGKERAESVMTLSHEVIDSSDPYVRTDSLTGVQVKTAGLLIQEAEKILMDSLKAQEGVKILQQVIGKNYRSSSDAAYLLGRLYYEDDDTSENIQRMKMNLTGRMERSNQRAHQLILQAVALDSTSYKALYELGCDYYAGEMRTGDPDSRDIDKALDCFRKSLHFASQANDEAYKEKCSKRIGELSL